MRRKLLAILTFLLPVCLAPAVADVTDWRKLGPLDLPATVDGIVFRDGRYVGGAFSHALGRYRLEIRTTRDGLGIPTSDAKVETFLGKLSVSRLTCSNPSERRPRYCSLTLDKGNTEACTLYLAEAEGSPAMEQQIECPTMLDIPKASNEESEHASAAAALACYRKCVGNLWECKSDADDLCRGCDVKTRQRLVAEARTDCSRQYSNHACRKDCKYDGWIK